MWHQGSHPAGHCFSNSSWECLYQKNTLTFQVSVPIVVTLRTTLYTFHCRSSGWIFKILQKLHCKDKPQAGRRQTQRAASHAQGPTVLLPTPCLSPVVALSPAGIPCNDVFCFLTSSDLCCFFFFWMSYTFLTYLWARQLNSHFAKCFSTLRTQPTNTLWPLLCLLQRGNPCLKFSVLPRAFPDPGHIAWLFAEMTYRYSYMLARLGLQAVRDFLCKYAAENALFITPTEQAQLVSPVRMEGRKAAPSTGEKGLMKPPAPCYRAVTS